jgi:ADP-ribose pyrophosphatase YjhB (NUDIX family)
VIITAAGIVVDHYGNVLLIQRNDTRTLAPPGGAAEIGELPTETAVREVREETGLIVMAVRLVGLYYLPVTPRPYLSLVFRCIMRGGEVTTSEESPLAGFFKTNPLPKPMLNFHMQRVKRSIRHEGGPPYWGTDRISAGYRLGYFLITNVLYRWYNFRRRRAGLTIYDPPPTWQARAATIMSNDKGEVLWVKDQESGLWRLPGGDSIAGEPPWKTAERSMKADTGLSGELNGLTGVYPALDKPEMTFCFSALMSNDSATQSSLESKFLKPDRIPERATAAHAAFAADAANDSDEITFRHLVPSLE